MEERIKPIVVPTSIANKDWGRLLAKPLPKKGSVPPLTKNEATKKLVLDTFMKYKALHEEIDYINSQMPIKVAPVRWTKTGWAVAIVAEHDPGKAFEQEILRSIMDADWVWVMADNLGVKRK